MTPVLAASTLIVIGDVVVEDGVNLDGKDVIFVYPIVFFIATERV